MEDTGQKVKLLYNQFTNAGSISRASGIIAGMQAKYVQVEKAGAPLQIVTREVPEPKPGEVRIKVEACGVCHSDSVTVQGLFPFLTYPRVPGHEIVGTVDAAGKDVPQWKAGQRARDTLYSCPGACTQPRR